jgi:hypothetical protein
MARKCRHTLVHWKLVYTQAKSLNKNVLLKTKIEGGGPEGRERVKKINALNLDALLVKKFG